ncbi:MAG TPA: hypothetical protein VGI19_16055 [Candidatus Cybelea sp.]|jgi:hypothetical protein
MRLSVASGFLLAALFVWSRPVAAESSGKGSYNYYEKRGNIEAMNAAFDAATIDWQRAEQLDPDPVKGCRGEAQRVQIRAATDAKAQMVSHHLTSTQGAAWYERHELELWIPNKCNGP